MSAATMTLIGLYNEDQTIFDLLTVPDGLNKATLIDNILLRSGEFEVLYPRPDFMKFSIGAFSRAWQPTFERWVKALSIEYDPLENYDRKEDWSDNKAGTTSGTTSATTSGTTGATTTNKVSAYDAGDALTTRAQDETHGSDSSSSSGSSSGSSSEGATHSGRVHGNIGVTTSQMMLISELDLGYWNVYEKITDLFLTHFVIPVY